MTKVNDDADHVLKLYTEGVDGLSEKDQAELKRKGTLTEQQAFELASALNDDGVIDTYERERLEKCGVREGFIAELEGTNGMRAFESRVKWLGSHINMKRGHNAGDRADMCRELGRLKHSGSVDELIEALSDKDAKVRSKAAEALGKIGDKRAVPALLKALCDKDAHVRAYAACALRDLGDKSIVPELIGLLKHEDAGVRWEVTWVLGELGDKSAIPAIKEGLKDENINVRNASADALRKLGCDNK